MGVRIDGSNDVVSAADGSLTVDGLSLSVTGIITASGGFKVGSAYTAYSNGNVETTGIITTTGGLVVETDGVERGRFTNSNQFVLGPRGSARTNFDNGTVGSNLLHIERQGTGANAGASFLSNTPHADSGAVLYMAKSRSTDNSSATIVSNGDQLGRISFQGADGSDYVEAASIRGHVDGSPGSNDMPGRLSFRTTADGGTSSTERLRIKSDGDVYIGNIAHANDNGANSSYRTLTLTDTTNGAQVHLRGQSPKLFMDVTSSGNAEIYYDSGDLRILSGEPGSQGSTERFRITSTGDVGIGTDNPAGNLEIDAASTTDMIMLDVAGTNFARLGHNSASGTNILDVRSEGHTRFLTNGNNERLRITSGGNVRVGSFGSPSNKNTVTPLVHVDGSGVNGGLQVNRHTSVGAGGAQLLLSATRGSSITGHTVLQDNDGIGSLVFAGSDGGEFVTGVEIQAVVDGTPGNDDLPAELLFKTNSGGAGPTERMRILSSGGLTFNGDTATANALNDYEEGTWTPTALNFDGTITVNSADYVKVGRLVHVNMYISFSNTTDTSNVLIGGLPFTVAEQDNHYSLLAAHSNGNIPDLGMRAQGTTTQLTAVYLNSSDGDSKPNYNHVRGQFIICGGTYYST